MAIDSSGDVAAGTANGLTTSPDIYVYRQGGDTPLNTFNLNSSGANLAGRGLARAPDGSQLFAVLYDYNGVTTAYTLQVLQNPTLAQPTLTLTGPARVRVTGSVTLTGTLTLPGQTAPPTAHLGTTYTSRTVSIYALPFGSGSRILLRTARVNSHGNLTVSYRAAHSAGTAVLAAASGSAVPVG